MDIVGERAKARALRAIAARPESGGSYLPVNPLRNRLSAAFLLSVVIGAPASSQQPIARVEPIPAVERFVQRTDPRVRLTVAKSSVAAFEDPGFVVHLDNVGNIPLRVNPQTRARKSGSRAMQGGAHGIE